MGQWARRQAVIIATIGFGFALVAIASGLVWASDLQHSRRQMAQSEQAVCQRADDDCAQKELLAQVRSAAAAEAMVDISIWQMAIGTVGLLAVGATLVFNALAVRTASAQVAIAERAATDALTNAREANEISREALQAPYKPLIQVTPSGPVTFARFIAEYVRSEQTKIPVSVSLAITNYGLGDAIIHSFHVTREGRDLAPALTMGRKLKADGSDLLIEPGKREMFSIPHVGEPGPAAHYIATLTGGDMLAMMEIPPFVVVVLYEDMLGIEWVASFGFQGRHLRSPRFRPWGGAKYNFHGRVNATSTPLKNLEGPVSWNGQP